MSIDKKLLQDKDLERKMPSSPELKFCLSWYLVTSIVLAIIIMIMLFWLYTLERSLIIGDTFLASMFNPSAYRKPVILVWTKLLDDSSISQFKPLSRCPYKCVFSDDRDKYERTARIRIFHALNFSAIDLPSNNPDALNVFYSMESPVGMEYKWNHALELASKRDYFNLTITYQQDSNIQYPFGVFEPRTSKDKNKDFYTYEEVEQAIDNKTELALAVATDCQTDSKRELLIEELKHLMPVTTVGQCYNANCDDKCLRSLESQHYFFFAFEDAICPDYVSEQFWRLKHLIVPVVMSRSVVPSSIPSFVFIAVDDFPTLQDFVNYLFKVVKDRNLYKSYFAWITSYRKSNRVREFFDLGCELCCMAYHRRRSRIKDIKKYLNYNQCKHAFGQFLLSNRQERIWEMR